MGVWKMRGIPNKYARRRTRPKASRPWGADAHLCLARLFTLLRDPARSCDLDSCLVLACRYIRERSVVEYPSRTSASERDLRTLPGSA